VFTDVYGFDTGRCIRSKTNQPAVVVAVLALHSVDRSRNPPRRRRLRTTTDENPINPLQAEYTLIMSSANVDATNNDNPIMVREDGGCEEEQGVGVESSPSSTSEEHQQQQQQAPAWTPLEKKIMALKVVPVISFLLMTIIVGATTLRPEYDQFAWMMYQVSCFCLLLLLLLLLLSYVCVGIERGCSKERDVGR
jgi:hypothetical protein